MNNVVGLSDVQQMANEQMALLQEESKYQKQRKLGLRRLTIAFYSNKLFYIVITSYFRLETNCITAPTIW